ncbi:hypothetical protein ABZ721_33150 [Streptomyces sp. NPDC006733]|uniref:hypothetical protein n=1 Tax=Streptomyces sp. NPDC006733 TaxID=3155460 RepID=UPI00340007AF
MTATARDMLAAGACVQDIIDATGLTSGEIAAIAESAGLTQAHADQAAQDAARQGEKLLDLLAWGEQHSVRSTQALAARARTALTELDTRRTREQEVQEASDEIARLERAITATRAKLSTAKGGTSTRRTAPATTKTPARTCEHRQARAWAKVQGLDCPTVGIVPARILTAWRNAGAPGRTAS